MQTAEQLPVAGHRGEPVPNEFLRRASETDHLAVLLPGFAYTCDMPLFYYAETVLLDAGADLLRVEYAYHRRAGFDELPEEEQRAWLFADAAAAYGGALTQRRYRAVTLVGKSLGTLAMGYLLAGDPPRSPIRAIWLTPLLWDDGVAERIERFAGSSLVAIGTADPHHDPAVLNALAAAGCEIVAVEGAEHSLDVPGDVAASVRAVGRVTEALAAFLARWDDPGPLPPPVPTDPPLAPRRCRRVGVAAVGLHRDERTWAISPMAEGAALPSLAIDHLFYSWSSQAVPDAARDDGYGRRTTGRVARGSRDGWATSRTSWTRCWRGTRPTGSSGGGGRGPRRSEHWRS